MLAVKYVIYKTESFISKIIQKILAYGGDDTFVPTPLPLYSKCCLLPHIKRLCQYMKYPCVEMSLIIDWSVVLMARNEWQSFTQSF